MARRGPRRICSLLDDRQPKVALELKYALDGGNANSYRRIFGVLGRYDRPRGPERPVFGKIRYMSSQNTTRKMAVKGYIQKYGGKSSAEGSMGFGGWRTDYVESGVSLVFSESAAQPGADAGR
jgi:hypothetical protein